MRAVTTVAQQCQSGGLGLNSLGNQLQAERLRQRDDCPYDREIAGIGAEVADEPPVDLECVNGKRLQVRQHAVPRAEIVDGDLNADLLEPGERDPGGLDVLNHNAFGDLQAYGPAVETEFGDYAGDRFDKAGGYQLNRRHVDAQHRVVSHAAGPPLRELRACRSHHPAAQFPCEIYRFGHADERVGREQSAGGMLPAHQRLGGQDLTGAHVDLGLVVQQQCATFDHALQMKLDVVAELTFQRHVVGEHRDLVAAGVLGGEHRLIRTTEKV